VNIGEAMECLSCGDRAQPEQDGDLIYYACGCGYEFGYQRVAQEQDNACQLGVPEEIRRAASPPDPGPGLPLLQIGRRPE
jgi:hypothetical protein